MHRLCASSTTPACGMDPPVSTPTASETASSVRLRRGSRVGGLARAAIAAATTARDRRKGEAKVTHQEMGSVKRLIDIAVSATGLVLLSPVLAGIALVSLILLGRPVLFRQERPGLRGRPFRLVKFRTMRADRSGEVERTPDAERLTRWGRFLRRQSLDELPELWNVLRGEMSLVGPRPLLVEYLPLYSARQARRHEVLPGMTGWAQVNGRNALSWEEKFELDVWYVDHRTLGLDLAILLATLTTVARRRGISAAGEATMRRFEGSETEAKEREGAT